MTATAGKDAPVFCVVEFVRGSRIEKEPPLKGPSFGPRLLIVQNGPPGTFVRFADLFSSLGGTMPSPRVDALMHHAAAVAA